MGPLSSVMQEWGIVLLFVLIPVSFVNTLTKNGNSSTNTNEIINWASLCLI